MKTDIKHLLKVVSLPLAISLILPFTDFLYWGDAKRLPMLKHVWVYWSAWPTVICNSFLLFVIPILIEIIRNYSINKMDFTSMSAYGSLAGHRNFFLHWAANL